MILLCLDCMEVQNGQGSYDKLNNQIIIPTNHYPWIIRTYHTCCLKNKPSAIRKAQQHLIDFNHFKAHSIYKNKCASCHRKNKNGRYVREFVGSTYIPSLNGITKNSKINFLKSLNEFLFSKFKKKLITEDELKILKNILVS